MKTYLLKPVLSVLFILGSISSELVIAKSTYSELLPQVKVQSQINKVKLKHDWQKQRFIKKTAANHKTWQAIPNPAGRITLPFDLPETEQTDSEEIVSSTTLNIFLSSLADLLLPTAAHADEVPQFDSIMIDGNLSDWTVNDRINLPLNLPPYLAEGDELYGRYIATPEPTYVIALKTADVEIAQNTTLWLNVDQDNTTGNLIWGLYGGSEYFVNIYADSIPYLYDQNFAWQSSVTHAYSADKHILEIAIPASALGVTTAQAINILGDINDSQFIFPQDYADGTQFTIKASSTELPARTDFSKRVAIVYSETTKNNFFTEKSYSQLFMSLQHQAMMAGISFDLITEDDLLSIDNLVNYDALIFPFFANVPSDKYQQIHDTLYTAIYEYGIGIMTADNWMTNDELDNSLSGDAYRNMKQLLGVGRVDGDGPVAINLSAEAISHPAMSGYVSNETVIDYSVNWYSYYSAVSGQISQSLVSQNVTGADAGTYPAMIATTTGGRNVHFATLGYMADTNLAWQALQWIVYGDENSVALKMGRSDNLFVSRNDMDQTQFIEEVANVHVPLYDLLVDWKQAYNFVGSYFINVGNNPDNGEWTDWSVSAPLFTNYVNIGNEIGTHSWTHPHFTGTLSSSEIEFEFNQSMNEIGTYISPTWRNENTRGAAVPGAPESLATASDIIQHVEYLTGGYSSVGAGFPSAFGYLTPDSTKVYLSPNMSFDFTLIEFGIPVGNPAVPTPLSAIEAEQHWTMEFNTLMSHASQPIIHWPWHDYAPTISADPVTGSGYTVAMFENTIAMAHQAGSEFMTSADVSQRINTFKNTQLSVTTEGSTMTASLNNAAQLGKFSLEVNVPQGQVIHEVNNWYAYDDTHVFLNTSKTDYSIEIGSSALAVTHINKLPMRAKLINVTGDGSNLEFSFEGEGVIRVALNDLPQNFQVTGATTVSHIVNNQMELSFDTFGLHSVTISHQ